MSVVGNRKWSLVAMGIVLAIIIVVTFALPLNGSSTLLSRAQSLLGFVVFLFLLWLTSKVHPQYLRNTFF